jgi:N utilization substance protein A
LIGQKWMRVKAVIDELWWEKVDIISSLWDIREIIKKSLTPAEVLRVEIDDEAQTAIVYILPTERAKAVGKGGANVNLASKLTWYQISIEDVEVEWE